MKYKKIILSILFLLICSFLLTGCWNYREGEEFAIVSGFAIDKEGDKYLFTAEIIEIKDEKGGGIKNKLVMAEGNTIFEAARNIIKISAKRLYFSHSQVVIISKDIAMEGITPVIDWIFRDAEPRFTLHLLISDEKSAKEIFKQEPVTQDIGAFEIEKTIKNIKNLSNSVDNELWEYLNDFTSKSTSPVLPLVKSGLSNEESKTQEVDGVAIFKDDKMVGQLSGEETKSMLFIKNEIKGGLLTSEVEKEGKKAKVTLEIFNNKTKIKPIYENGKISFIINVLTDVAIAEIGGEIDLMDEEGQKETKKQFEEKLTNDIKTLFTKVQSEYGCDIFGFGNELRMKNPKEWRKIEKEWDNKFKDVKITVQVEINIKNSATMYKPIKQGE